jgi:hypothetical protein
MVTGVVTIALSPLQAREVVARQTALAHYLAAIVHAAGLAQGEPVGVKDGPEGPVLEVRLNNNG